MRPHVPGSLPAACMLFSPLHQAWLIPVAHMDMYVFRKVHCRGSSKVCGQCEGVLLNGLHLLATTASWYMVPVVGEGVGGGRGLGITTSLESMWRYMGTPYHGGYHTKDTWMDPMSFSPHAGSMG